HRLVGEGARARHHAHRALLVDVARHDADLELVGRDHAGAVRPHEQRLAPDHAVLRADHVAHRNALGESYHEIEPCIHRVVDRGGREGRRHVDHRDRGSGGLACVLHRAEDGNALEVLACLFWIHARDVAVLAVGVLDARARVELAGLAGNALRHHTGVLVDQDAHFAAFTTFSAASAMLLAEMIGSFESARIFFPRSTLVPSRRTTSGTCRLTALEASTSACAITSQRMMPPKMLTRIAFRAGVLSMILNASVTFSVVAPPPTSRKLAGLPP